MNPNNNPKSGMDNRILDTDYEILGYNDKLSYTEMYRVLFYSLASLHRQSMRFEAIEMFNDCIGDFKPLWDEIFLLNYQSIDKAYSNAVDRYRLHRAELIALLQRAGLIDLPDLRYNAVPSWIVPENIQNLKAPEDIETPENLEDTEDFEDLEYVEDLEDPEDMENMEDLEDGEDIEDFEDMEDLEEMEDPEDIEDPEEIEDPEDIEDPEEIEDPEDIEDPEEIEDPGDIEDPENNFDISNIFKRTL